MKLKFPTLFVLLSLIASSAHAELVVVNGRYIVAKDDIRGYFYRQGESSTVFDIRWSDWSTQYSCQDVYDRTQVEAAALNFTLKVAEANSLDFEEFLADEGFTNCEKF